MEGRKVAEYDVLVFDREVFREDVVGAADDEFVDQGKEFPKAFVAALAVGICACCVAAAEDGEFVFLTEFHTGAEEVGVCEVDQSEVLGQVVLDGCSREDDSPVDVEVVEGGKGLAFAVLESMSFITQEETDRRAEFIHIEPESLVRDDQYWSGDGSTTGNRPLPQL